METKVQLNIIKKNAQIVCPKKHKLNVVEIPSSKEIVLFCNKCKQFYPFPKL